MARVAKGTVSFRQLVQEASQEMGYKPTGSPGWQAALDKLAKPGVAPTGNGMVKRNPEAAVKLPAPMMKPLSQRWGGLDSGAPLLPLAVEHAKRATKQGGR